MQNAAELTKIFHVSPGSAQFQSLFCLWLCALVQKSFVNVPFCNFGGEPDLSGGSFRSLASLPQRSLRPLFNLEVARRSRSSQIFTIHPPWSPFRSPSLLSSNYSPKREHRLDSVGIMTMDGLGMVGLAIHISSKSLSSSPPFFMMLLKNLHHIDPFSPRD